MSKKLNESPNDKFRAVHGEMHQANYLINAKGRKSESKAKRELLTSRTK
jgi:hypothetical protein